MTNAMQSFHNRYAKSAMYTDYAGHRIYYVAKSGRAIIVRDGKLVATTKTGSMPLALWNARLIVNDINIAIEDEYNATHNIAPHKYIGY